MELLLITFPKFDQLCNLNQLSFEFFFGRGGGRGAGQFKQ